MLTWSPGESGACDGEDGHDDGTHFDVVVVVGLIN